MPTYEYQCQECKHCFDVYQSITARPLRKCPVCHQNKVTRLLSAGGGVIFKGSGFYETDYRSDGYKKAAKAEQGGGAAGKGESTPAGSDSKKQTTPATPPAEPPS